LLPHPLSSLIQTHIQYTINNKKFLHQLSDEFSIQIKLNEAHIITYTVQKYANNNILPYCKSSDNSIKTINHENNSFCSNEYKKNCLRDDEFQFVDEKK